MSTRTHARFVLLVIWLATSASHAGDVPALGPAGGAAGKTVPAVGGPPVTDPVYLGWNRGCVVYRYSHADGKWRSWTGPKAFLPDKLIPAVGPAAAAGVDPGTGYGGWLFDLHAEKWTTIPPSPIAPPRGSMDPIAAAFVGHELVVWGADDGDVQGAALDTKALTWRPVAKAPVPPRYRCVTAVAGTKLLVWGGYGPWDERRSGPLDSGAVYDAPTDTWTKMPPAPVEGAPSWSAGAESNGRLVVVGYWPGGRQGAMVFDPAAGKWEALPDVPFAAGSYSSCAADKDRLFVWSGNPPGARGATAEGAVYEFAKRKWQKLPEAPIEPRVLAFARVQGPAVTFWGGWLSSPTEFMMDGATYDAASRTWKAIARLPGDAPYEMHPGW